MLFNLKSLVNILALSSAISAIALPNVQTDEPSLAVRDAGIVESAGANTMVKREALPDPAKKKKKGKKGKKGKKAKKKNEMLKKLIVKDVESDLEARDVQEDTEADESD
ncbi:hypothetical protein HK103_001292 [Boothiomyces macroporosus]|uniref:Uncharacterized protein n=1 Tax=Boothiomyces macroporosus TaxID=261099 RepID=A0AAD5Y100_9FUNG|nr:hypothetical protein HK103_001292 [Boothiomyces macroporosus]